MEGETGSPLVFFKSLIRRGAGGALAIALILLYLEKGCIGRIRASQILGYPERRLRSLIDILVENGILERQEYRTCISGRVRSILSGLRVERVRRDKYTLCFYKGFGPEATGLVVEKISRLRDYLVIELRDPNVFEVIGVAGTNGFFFPGVPDELAARYADLIGEYRGEEAVVVLWRRYKAYLYDGALIYSLVKLDVDGDEDTGSVHGY